MINNIQLLIIKHNKGFIIYNKNENTMEIKQYGGHA